MFERHPVSVAPFSRGTLSRNPEQYSGGTFVDDDYVPLRFYVLKNRLNALASMAEVLDRSVISNVSEATTVNRDLQIAGAPGETLTVVSSDESVAAVTGLGHIERRSNGTATITVTSDKGRFDQFRYAASMIGGVIVKTYNRHVVGSLGAHCCAQVDDRIAGTDRNVARHIYTSFPSNSSFTAPGEVRGAVDKWIRNPAFWGAGIPNLPCYSAGLQRVNETTWRRNPHATMLSPVHFLTVWHLSPSVGQKLAFVALDGTLHIRTVVGTFWPGFDARVGILDSPLPASIPPAKMMPYPELISKMPIDQQGFIPGMLTENQQHGCVGLLQDHWQLPRKYLKWWSTYGAYFDAPYTNYPKRKEFVDTPADNLTARQGIEVGDSGSPAFLIVKNELVLCTVWIVAGAGTNWTEQQVDLQSYMDQLSTTHGLPQYNLTTADISEFPNF